MSISGHESVLTARDWAVIQHFVKCQTSEHVEEVFQRHADITLKEIIPPSFNDALKDCGVFLSSDECEMVFKCTDLNENGSLNLEEFKLAVKTPSKIEQWASSLPLPKLLAVCIDLGSGEDALRRVSELDPNKCAHAADLFSTGLKLILPNIIKDLKESFAAMDRIAVESKKEGHEANSKFQTFKMNCGSVKDFHAGLLERIGAPHPNLKKGVEGEHCTAAGCDEEFTTANYGVVTTPKKEYEIVVTGRPCPDRDCLDKKGNCVRHVKSLDELKTVRVASQAGLSEDEIIAAVLYTGPMYQIYNALLRRFPKDVYDRYHLGGNNFPTTIHVLVSAVVKIARVMRLPIGMELYRGLGGFADLPDSFFQADEHGCRGYLEWGFLSTTSNKYSGVEEGSPKAMVLRACVGAIDRGACIAALSQYPAEVEYLWVPCSFIEPMGAMMMELVPAADGGGAAGVVTVVPVRINANLKALTVEGLRNQKKDLHLTSFGYMLQDVANDLRRIADDDDGAAERKVMCNPRERDRYTVGGFLAKIEARCRAVMARHAKVPPEDFAVDEVQRALVVEMLETKASALSTLRFYIENSTFGVEMLTTVIPMTAAHRLYTCFLEGRLPVAGDERVRAAEQLCRIMGLIVTTVDARDADGFTRLMRAAADGESPRVLRCLVAARADPNAADPLCGIPAMSFAIQNGHEHLLEPLHALGGDVDAASNETNGGSAPLHIAILESRRDAVEILVRLGCDVNKPMRGERPLALARARGHYAIAAFLERFGAV